MEKKGKEDSIKADAAAKQAALDKEKREAAELALRIEEEKNEEAMRAKAMA